MTISSKIGPERAAELLNIVLEVMDTEHPAWLELSLLSSQIEKQAKDIAAFKREKNREVAALERDIASKIERLKAGFVFYDTALVLASNEWADDDFVRLLGSAAADVILKLRHEVFPE